MALNVISGTTAMAMAKVAGVIARRADAVIDARSYSVLGESLTVVRTVLLVPGLFTNPFLT